MLDFLQCKIKTQVFTLTHPPQKSTFCLSTILLPLESQTQFTLSALLHKCMFAYSKLDLFPHCTCTQPTRVGCQMQFGTKLYAQSAIYDNIWPLFCSKRLEADFLELSSWKLFRRPCWLGMVQGHCHIVNYAWHWHIHSNPSPPPPAHPKTLLLSPLNLPL